MVTMSLDLSWQLSELNKNNFSNWEDVYARISELGYTVDGEEGKIPLRELTLYQRDLSSWEGFRPGSLRSLRVDNNHVKSWKGFNPGNMEALYIDMNLIRSWDGFDPGSLRKLSVSGNPIRSWQGFYPGEITMLIYFDIRFNLWEGFKCGKIRHFAVGGTHAPKRGSYGLYCLRDTWLSLSRTYPFDRRLGTDVLRPWLIRQRTLLKWIHRYRARRLCTILGFRKDSTFYYNLLAEMDRD
jgi:hypothetical protein